MAYRGYKVVAFTPSGRKRTQSILIENLRRFVPLLDEYQVWINTDEEQVEDLKWLRSLPDTYDWIKVVELPKDRKPLKPKQLNTGVFYAHNTIEKDTIYIRFDDDIVFVDDSFFVNLLDFRIDNPGYFCVMANIWNNAIISFIHQLLGGIPKDTYTVEEPYCMDPVGWENPKFAELIHRILINHIQAGTTSELFFDHADLNDAHRFSISCFCFFGKDFAEFDGVVGQRNDGSIRFDEEIWLTEVYPTTHKKLNTICGSALVSHYTFLRQRPHIDSTDILKTYGAIAKQKLSDFYYDMLPGSEPAREPLPAGLKTVVLPKLTHSSSIADSLLAEIAGCEVINRGRQVDIVYKGQVIKSLIGAQVTARDVDQALANIWRTRLAPLQTTAT